MTPRQPMDPTEQDTANSNNSTMQRQLPTALQLHILSQMSHNDRALSGRLVSLDAAATLSEPQHCTASLSQLLPPHAAPWATEAGQQHMRQLPFRHKLQLLSTAAASGSEVNLEVALALLQPSVFPELLQRWVRYDGPDPGVAAVRAGHPQLLRWLLRHCPGLVHQQKALAAAARHCDLAGLQATWEVLCSSCSGADRPPALDQVVLDQAAGSPSLDAVAKVQWVLASTGQGGLCSLQESTAAAAARVGDLGRLRWLHDRGCPMRGEDVLPSALRHADLAVAQWLVDEAGCQLPEPGPEYGNEWKGVFTAAVKGCDGVAKLRWLQENGAPTLNSIAESLPGLAVAAVRAGQMEVLLHLQAQSAGLLDLQGQAASPGLLWKLEDGAMASGIRMAERLKQHGLALTVGAYTRAAAAGDAAVVRWLAMEARVPTAGLDLVRVVHVWPRKVGAAHRRGLLTVVRLLVEEAGCSGWDGEAAVCAAAARGDLALVQYLHGYGQQWLEEQRSCGRVVCAAAEGGCEAVLEWVVQQPGCEGIPGDGFTYVGAAKNGDCGMVTALRRLGVPWGVQDVVLRALLWGCHEPGLRWLVAQGAPVGRVEEVERAVAYVVGRTDWSAEDAEWLRGLVAAAAGGP